MALKIQFTFRDGPALETVVVDASVSETHSFTAQVTDFPVEDGAAVSDNIRANPVSLRIEAFISDFPLVNEGRVQTSSAGVTGFQRPSARSENSKLILEKLRRLQTEGVVVNVDTGLQRYENMVLETLEVPRDKTLKNGIRANLGLKQIRIVKTQTVDVKRAREPKGQPKTKDGDKTGKPADQATIDKRSLVVRVVDSIKKVVPQ